MRAVGIAEFGGPEVLHVIELPTPAPASGEVRIRVRAAGVNPADRNTRTGVWADPPDVPVYVPGMEVAGDLEEISPGTQTDLVVGDRVMAFVVPRGTHGGYAEQIVLPAESVVRAPSGSTYPEAASLPMCGLTARKALDALELRPGQVVAVTGAAGAVGGFAVQLAKADGLRVVADSAASDVGLVKFLGADVVVSRGQRFAQAVRDKIPAGVDGAVDAAGLDAALIDAVADNGRASTLRGFQGEMARGVTFVPVMSSIYHRDHAALELLRRQAEAGEITLRVSEVFAMDHADEAHRRLDAGGVRGRLVISF